METNKEKFYVGFSLGFNSSAAVISSDRGIVAAISQERLNGIKNTKEIPFEAIRECLKLAGAKAKQIESVSYSHYQEFTIKEIRTYVSRQYEYLLDENDVGVVDSSAIDLLFARFFDSIGVKVRNKKLERVEHHQAHLASALAVYGPRKRYFAVTSDGFGDGISGRISYHGIDGIYYDAIASEISMIDSVALVYQFVTGALGFKEHQHEGKITGLAAYGHPLYVGDFVKIYNKVSYGHGYSIDRRQLEDLSDAEMNLVKHSTIKDFGDFLKLKRRVYKLVGDLVSNGADRADIAASVQNFAENLIVGWIYDNVRKILTRYDLRTKVIPCYLAGGLFANVRINQRIKDTGLFSDVFVAPPMGDEGTALGAAYVEFEKDGTCYPPVFPSDLVGGMLGGTFINSSWLIADEIISGCESEDYYFRMNVYDGRVSEFVARALQENKLVCVCQGRMEFGPRALCNRSILYSCTDKTVNSWLNEQLGRTEFMPFAPVCMEEDADDLFYNLDGGRLSAKFMTMTFDCKPEFASNYPAACHVDLTARPQIVSKNDHPFMYNVLSEYKRLTGKKALINTSFNLHNNPIIESEEVAIKSWLASKTDILILNSFVIERVKRNVH